jgi:hypothetical protein
MTKVAGNINYVGPSGGVIAPGGYQIVTFNGVRPSINNSGIATLDDVSSSGIPILDAIDNPFYQGGGAFNMATSGAHINVIMYWQTYQKYDFEYTTTQSGIIPQKDGLYLVTAAVLSDFNLSEQWSTIELVKNGLAVYGAGRMTFTPLDSGRGTTSSTTHLIPLQSGDILGVQVRLTGNDPGSKFYANMSSLTVNRVYNVYLW